VKKIYLRASIFILLFSSLLQAIDPAKSHNPLLVVTLMIRNEALVIKETLQPFVDAGIKDFLIFEAGESTDDTIAVTKKFFEDHQIKNAVIKQGPFIDFATSRNQALELTEEAFPNAGFILMPDAEWHLHNGKELLQFCAQHRHDTHNVYLMRTMGANLDFCTPRLIRCQANVRFVGVVHEVPNYYTQEKVPPNIFFELCTTRYGQEKSRQRWTRDRDLLLKEHMRVPHDPRPVFYLAQTYACLGDWENAKHWYMLRTKMPGWDEETFIAHYKLAQVYEALGKWHEALEEYLKAHALRPQRAEPLVCLANHYWNSGDKASCFLFAQRAAQLPYPDKDLLFIEKDAYNFTRFDLLGRAAWYVGEYDCGETAINQALEVCPNAEYLNSNLGWYKQHKLALSKEPEGKTM